MKLLNTTYSNNIIIFGPSPHFSTASLLILEKYLLYYIKKYINVFFVQAYFDPGVTGTFRILRMLY